MKKFLSRKLVMTLFGILIVPVFQKWGVPAETIDWLLTTLVTYLGAQGAVDAVVAFKASAGDPAAAGAPSK